MWKLMWWMVAQAPFGTQFVDCGCLCVDGAATTVCQSVAEAQRQPNLCPPQLSCPAVPAGGSGSGDDEHPIYYDAPSEDAHNCRDVRIWDESVAAYTGVKVCDVFTG